MQAIRISSTPLLRRLFRTPAQNLTLSLLCYMMELDEKYASVILRRYVEDTGNAEGVYVIRNGQQISYAELVKEVETKEA